MDNFRQPGLLRELSITRAVVALFIATTVTLPVTRSHASGADAASEVIGWGFNDDGQLGDGTQTDRNTAVKTMGLANVVAVSAGSRFGIALEEDGTVWAWGYDYAGQLGDGRGEIKTLPQRVPGLRDVVAISAGNSHVLALKRDGTVWAWGFGQQGQLGHGMVGSPVLTANDERIYSFGRPIQVLGLNHVRAISAGGYHSLALKQNGTVWGWGSNVHSELGQNEGKAIPFPVQIRGVSDVVAISAGYWHNLVLKRDGTVWGWGYNNYLLGGAAGSSSAVGAPVKIDGLPPIKSISAGRVHNLVVDINSHAWAWGNNEFGVLGLGQSSDYHTVAPIKLSGLTDVVGVAAAYNHSVALTSKGSVWTWGSNEYEMLGNGERVPPGRMRRMLLGLSADYTSEQIDKIPMRSSPAPVLNASAITAISASHSGWHTLALVRKTSSQSASVGDAH